MSREFNKDLMIKNISLMLTEMCKKIGELEAEVGVSAGYISRTAKDPKSKPGIDFVVKVAEALNTSMDTLLNVDLGELTPTERYLISFLEKLKNDTLTDKLDWVRESAASLNRMETDINGYVDHPLFSLETFYEQSMGEYPEEVTRVVMLSKRFDCHTVIEGDCFNLKMNNGAILYVMSIVKSVRRVGDMNAYAKEIWMSQYGKKRFLCDNSDDSVLAPLVEELYSILKENSKHPKIDKDLKAVIDLFMAGEIEDEVCDEELPFN